MMQAGMKVGSGLVLAMMIWAAAAEAQVSNWWTEQYGTRAQMLGGAVVGSFLDLSSTYYNPGALALVDDPEVLLSAEAFQYQLVRINNTENASRDQSTTTFGTAPTLFAGLLPSKWLTGQLAYSALTRQDFDFRLEARLQDAYDVLEGLPGDEFYAIETYYDHELTENWFGLTWSYAPRKNIGIGATLYGAYRSRRIRAQNIAQATNADQGATTVLIDQYKYKTLRFVAKVGVALDYSPLELGIAVTTPSLKFLGSGSAYYNRNVSGFDLDGDGQPDSRLEAGDQEDVSATYKSPVSIAVGASYRWERSAVHFSCEWFAGIPEYRLLELPDPTSDTDPMESLIDRVTVENDPVFNVGVGMEQQFSDHVHGYVSFTTDFSADARGSSETIAPRSWDLYHIGAGTELEIEGLSLTLGFAAAFGSQDHQTLVDPMSAGEDNQLLGDPVTSNIDYRRLKLIVGFAFTL